MLPRYETEILQQPITCEHSLHSYVFLGAQRSFPRHKDHSPQPWPPTHKPQTPSSGCLLAVRTVVLKPPLRVVILIIYHHWTRVSGIILHSTSVDRYRDALYTTRPLKAIRDTERKHWSRLLSIAQCRLLDGRGRFPWRRWRHRRQYDCSATQRQCWQSCRYSRGQLELWARTGATGDHVRSAGGRTL